MSQSNKKSHHFVICIQNDDFPTSLEVRKIYEVLPDSEAEKHHQVRVIDESGEDYLYPENFFIPIKLTKNTEEAILKVA